MSSNNKEGDKNLELYMVSEKNEFSTEPMAAYEINEQNVRRIIEKKEHPNPTLILSFVVILLLIIYYIYISFVKNSFSGIWISDNDQIFKIYHNKWSDNINIMQMYIDGSNDIYYANGYVLGNAIYLLEFDSISMGVIYNNKIYWANSNEVWILPGYIY